MKSKLLYDVIIAGAGPAGMACALALKESGMKVAVLEKKTFPRDKICGDAIPHRAVKVLKEISTGGYELFQRFSEKIKSGGCRVVAPDKKYVDIFFSGEGYLSARMDFDNFLFECASGFSHAEIICGAAITQIVIEKDGVKAITPDGTYEGRMIIGCDGAHSVIEKQTTARKLNHRHYSGAVRSYVKNINGIQQGMMEIHLYREFPSAYFWIFPLHSGISNVGLGMLSEKISEGKVSLRQELMHIISNKRFLGNRFEGSEILSPPAGFGLPLGSHRVKLSGLRYMLCGDAASLIDPATGEGIGNAMLSGMLAAKQAQQCFEKNDFSADFMKQYDETVYRQLGKDLRSKYFLQRILGSSPSLINFAINAAGKSTYVRKFFQKLF